MIRKGTYQHNVYKHVRVTVEEDCDVYLTVKFKQRGVAYRDLKTGKLCTRLLGDFRESYSLVE
jgi:hypothetical protein